MSPLPMECRILHAIWVHWSITCGSMQQGLLHQLGDMHDLPKIAGQRGRKKLILHMYIIPEKPFSVGLGEARAE